MGNPENVRGYQMRRLLVVVLFCFLLSVLLLPLATLFVDVKVGVVAELTGLKEEVYYMICQGRPLPEIEKALQSIFTKVILAFHFI